MHNIHFRFLPVSDANGRLQLIVKHVLSPQSMSDCVKDLSKMSSPTSALSPLLKTSDNSDSDKSWTQPVYIEMLDAKFKSVTKMSENVLLLTVCESGLWRNGWDSCNILDTIFNVVIFSVLVYLFRWSYITVSSLFDRENVFILHLKVHQTPIFEWISVSTNRMVYSRL